MTSKKLMALLMGLALVAAACGGSGSDAASDGGTSAGDGGSSSSDGADTVGTAGTPAIDIDAVLDADLDNCAEAPTGEPIKVGMALDFGDVSGFADIPGSEAVNFLVELINCSGGYNGSPIETSVQDIQGDPEVTARATQDLVDFGSHFMIGPPFADFGQPVLQVTGGKIPVFFAASTEPSLPDVAANSFLVTFDDTGQATAAAEYALEQGFKRAITFSSPGPYFGYNPEIFTEVFTAGGGEVVIDQTYVPVDDVDFSAQVNAVAEVADGTEVVYSAMLGFQLTALRGQLEGQGLDALTYMSTDAFEATGGLAEQNIDGIVHTTHAFVEPGGRIDRLLTAYEAAKGTPIESGSFAGLYADSLLLGLQGMADCGCTDPEQIGAAVAQIGSFDGFTGEMSYAGTNGIPVKPVSIHKVVGTEDTLAASWG
ncbi:MAG: ABC transporter substrate-binding protein [Acidimicrobiales bacterium]